MTGMKVAQALERARQERGSLPENITVDNGSEFSNQALEAWAMGHEVELCFIRLGRPVENGFIESFNGRLRDECLNVEWFATLEDARAKLARFRDHYNCERPHNDSNDAEGICEAVARPSMRLQPNDAGRQVGEKRRHLLAAQLST